ncbi:MAG: CopG family transcriptional regulator [Ruminococcus sp.]|nr:CopG family transcriptional regulator [Ruminococcus sp.]
MDKKYIEYPNKFDKKEYDKNYRKEHYVRFSASVKPELKKRVDDYCKKEKISKTEFIRRAIDMFENNE